MVIVAERLSELSFGSLMRVYEHSNRLNARDLYGNMDTNAGILQAEQDFYAYLKECFFETAGAKYLVWEEQGRYISALRLEPFEDGVLLAALETVPEMRRRGYAEKLVSEAVRMVNTKVYSHVRRNNLPSFAVHQKCGFQKISDSCVYIDGTTSDNCCTLMWQKEK